MQHDQDAFSEDASAFTAARHSIPDHQYAARSDSTVRTDGMDPKAAIAYALRRLATELAPELSYHNLFHTQDDVLPAVRRLAVLSHIEANEIALLEVAAAFHDIGYLVRRDEHESAGAGIVSAVLPSFGFSPDQVTLIHGMILATRLPQSPRTLLEQLLADADLDVLGRPDSLPRAEALRAELAACGHPTTDAQWYAEQIEFMRDHQYFTPAARALRDAGKWRAIAIMEALATAYAGQS